MKEQDLKYIGEHLWAGNLGNAFISIAFAAALFSAFGYFLAHKNPLQTSYRKFSRILYGIHVLSVFGTIGMLFLMMINHYFEYAYVWKHTNLELESRYLFAAFWEDQEGSFLLWTFWHAVIGSILLFSSGKWEAPVMMTLCFVQVFLLTMVMGIYIGDTNIGTNPFILMRNHPQYHNIPLFTDLVVRNGEQVVDYIAKLTPTARGMNPLLKNYWMTIHPPTLFAGFALTVVPFCFSIAGLMTGRHREWQRIALPWAFAGVMILGTGILMGGAWAYEALSFGGFWAWDPVENASFVPWLTLVGAAHLMIVNKARGTSFFSTYLFSVISFILVLYSTFLTRSGILGESSVHAFTDLGMERLLIYFVLAFIILPVALFIENKKIKIAYLLFSFVGIGAVELLGHRTPMYIAWFLVTLGVIFYQYFKSWAEESGSEESAWSREFWIFIGSLLLFILALSISGITSFPVINRLFSTKLAVKNNGINVFNVMGMIFGIFILTMIGISQFLKYKDTAMKKFWRNFIVSGVLAFILTMAVVMNYFNREAWIAASPSQKTAFFVAPAFVFFACFAFFANFDYLLRVLKGKIKNSGAAIAHAGFALIMLGCVISNSGKRVISQNTSNRDVSVLGGKFNNNNNIFLAKGDTLRMGEYFVTYKGKKKEGIHILYEVEYFTEKNGKKEHAFTLFPKVQLNKMMGNAAEPGTKHFLTKDIYTDITHAELVDAQELELQGGWTGTENNVLHAPTATHQDSIITNEYIITLDSLRTSLTQEEYEKQDSLIVVTAVLSIRDMNNNITKAYPQYVLHKGQIEPKEFVDEERGVKFVFWKINPDEGTVEITLSQKVSKKTDYIVMEAMIFPWINVLWTGCVVMILGTGLALWQRIRKIRRETKTA